MGGGGGGGGGPKLTNIEYAGKYPNEPILKTFIT